MSDKKEDTESTTNRIETNAGDNATNVVSGIGNTLTHNQHININIPSGMNRPRGKEELSNEEKELLKAGYDNEICTVSHLGSHLPMIWVGQHTFPEDIKYKRALKSLRDNQLIRRIVERSIETYELTGEGDAIAKTLT